MFVFKEDTTQFFSRNNSLQTVQFSLTKKKGHNFNTLIQKYVSEE